MLVVSANWAFTDGTVAATAGRARAGRAWLRSVRRAAIRAGFGRDGRYHPPDVLDLVLAGDTFDCLVSSVWSGGDRPWRGGSRTAEARRRVLLGCVRRAAPFLAALTVLARRGLRVPGADRRGRPSVAAEVRIPVRVTLLPGDRDLPVLEASGEVAARAATVAPCWTDGSVFVGHGHEFDPACHAPPGFPGADRPPTLAESVTVDLVVPFLAALAGTAGPRGATAGLAAAVAASSVASLPGVIAGWMVADGHDDGGRCGVVPAWRRAVDAWLRQARRMPPECGLPASPLESLAAWLHAAAAGPAPEAIAGLFDRAVPPPPAAAGAVVLGHPLPAVGDEATICLGRPAVRRCGRVAVVRADGAAEAACVAANPPPVAPPTVARRRAAEAFGWLQSTEDEPAAPARAGSAMPVVDAA